MKNFKNFAIASVLLLGSAVAASAQANTVEIAAGGGLASFHSNGQTSNKGQFDASISYNLLSNVAIGFEYAYTPIDSLNTTISGVSVKANEHFNTFGGVARFGFTREVKVQPYVLVAGGGLRDTISATASQGNASYSASQSESGGYVGFGAGLNARLGGGFGVRPEVRYQHLSENGSGLNELSITGSLFYTFGGERHHSRR